MLDGGRESSGSLLDVGDVLLSEDSSHEGAEDAPRKRGQGLTAKEATAANCEDRIVPIKRENARHDGMDYLEHEN